jgi:adsorption protein B
MLGIFFAFYHELLLACCCGIILLGVDDLILWGLWVLRVRPKSPQVTPTADDGPCFAIFVPAWDEGEVIGAMLEALLGRLDYPDYVVFVGGYPNDPATESSVRAIADRDPRVQFAGGLLPGPTTKAECLNRCWSAMIEWEIQYGREVAAIVLHDAEDLVHPDELRVFAAHLPRFDMVQLPVLPLIHRSSPFVSGHYADEFALAHSIDLPTRWVVRAALPSAGVGCAISRAALHRIASQRHGQPFDADSLTEDYELGLRLGELGYRSAFVRQRSSISGELVAVRAYFPDRLDTAVRQKARWILGIALFGWDRLGWHGSLAEHWMRMRDRRALLSALVVMLAYMAMMMGAVSLAIRLDPFLQVPPTPWPLQILIRICGGLLFWRLMERALVVFRLYGFRQALLSIPRALVGNVIAMMAARRAFMAYLRHRSHDPVNWDKTSHVFPDEDAR